MKRKLKIGLGVAGGLFLLFFIGVTFLVKPFAEYGLHRAGFAQASVGAASFSLSGSTLKNVRLDANGSSIGEVRLYATAQDFLGGRLTKVEIAGAALQWPLPVAASGKTGGALNLGARQIEVKDSALTLKTDSGDLPVSFSGTITDRDDKYQTNINVDGKADFAQLSGKLTGDLIKATGAAKLHFELTEAKATLPDLDMKRATGFIDVDVDPANPFPLPNAQVDFGEMKVYGLPLQGAKVSASAAEGKLQFSVQAHVPNDSGDINADFTVDRKDPASDSVSLKAQATLKQLDALGLENVKGAGDLMLSLTGVRAKSADFLDMTGWKDLQGTAGVDMDRLSLPGLLKNAKALATMRVALDPAKQQVVAHPAEGELTFSGTFKALGSSPVYFSIPGSGKDEPAIFVWDQKEKTLSAGFDGATFTGFGVQAQRMTASLTAHLGDAPSLEGSLNVGELSHTVLPQDRFFVPVRVALQFARDGNTPSLTTLQGDITEKSGRFAAKIAGKHDSATTRGDMQVNMPPTALTQHVNELGSIFPISLAYLQDGYGTLGLSGDFAWGKGAKGWVTASRGKLYLKDFTCTVRGNAINGINTVMDLDSLFPLVVTQQKVAVGAINVSLPLTNGLVVMSLSKNHVLTVHSAEWTLAKGKVTSTPFQMDLASMSADVTLTASNLDLPELMKAAPTEGLMTTGTVNGTLPLYIRNGEFTISNGELQTNGPGTIKYDQAKLPSFLQGATQQSLLDLKSLLTQFNYDSLGMTLDGTLGQSQKIVLHIKGKNPLFYSGRPVDFNLNLEGPLGNVLKYNPGGSQIPDSIKQKLEAYEASHAKL